MFPLCTYVLSLKVYTALLKQLVFVMQKNETKINHVKNFFTCNLKITAYAVALKTSYTFQGQNWNN